MCYPNRMSSQQNRPNKPSGNKAKPVQSVKRPVSQPLAAAKTSVPTSNAPSKPLTTTSTKSATGKSITTTTTAATNRAKAVPKTTYAPASQKTDASGTAAKVVRAFTSGFPFAGLEYVIFLAVVEMVIRLAVPLGLILLGLACGIFYLKQQAKMREDASEGNLLTTVRQWLGDPQILAGSLALLGAGMISFTRWSATGAQIFSVLAVIALIAAILLIFVASYQRDAQPA
jgi:hypothetical protein